MTQVLATGEAEPNQPPDRESFRVSMRHLASGVCIVTTNTQDGKRWGLTATAICSVTADPPMLLACVNKTTGTCAAILAAGHFAVNLLSAEDRELSNRFASPIAPEQRFAEGRWESLVTGAPVLRSALAVFDCALEHVVEVATHKILVGGIRALQPRDPDIKPLLYSHGGYATAERLDAPKGLALASLAKQLSADPHFLEDCMHWGPI